MKARPSRRVGVTAVAGLVAVALAGMTACGESRGRRDLGREALQNLSDRERVALADKRVDFGEYESANRHASDCLTALGLTVDPLELGKDGTFSIGWLSVGKSEQEMAALDVETERCHAEINAINAVYVLQHGASKSELQDAEQDFRSCVEELGLSNADSAPVGQLAVALQDQVGNGAIDRPAAEACVQIIEAVDAQPLPGLEEALEQLDL